MAVCAEKVVRQKYELILSPNVREIQAWIYWNIDILILHEIGIFKAPNWHIYERISSEFNVFILLRQLDENSVSSMIRFFNKIIV